MHNNRMESVDQDIFSYGSPETICWKIQLKYIKAKIFRNVNNLQFSIVTSKFSVSYVEGSEE